VLATIPEAPAGIPKQNAIPQHNTTPQAAHPGFPSEQTQHRRLDASHEVSTQRKPPVSQARAPEARTPLPLPVTFSASWEVDRFFWPEVAMQIAKSHGEAFQQIGKHLRLANQEGLKVMAVTSGERGVGRSTVAMHLARCAAAAGLSVALMDADTFYPSLVDQLRLDVEHGWQDCLFENVPLEEAAVRSIEDRITVFPLTSVVSAQQMHANLHRMSKIVKRIASAFDIVILDSNRLNLEQREMVGVSQESIVDAAIVVVDTELSIKEKVDTAVSILQGMGIASVGMVENFNG
jgi:Mrp family chromosome partitioning ATPase